MPTRPYTIDIGFDTATVKPDEPEVPSGGAWAGPGMVATLANPAMLGVNIQQNLPTVGAAFELENDIVNFWSWMNRPQFEAEQGFDLERQLKLTDMWDEYRWNFVGVESSAEFAFKAAKIKREQEQRALLAAAGPNGILMSMLAGSVSPTVLLPFVGTARGAKAVGTGLMWGLAGGAANEIPLQLDQELRTMEESALSVGLSTILGGVLGGAAGYLRKPISAIEADMAVMPGISAIPTSKVVQDLEAELENLRSQISKDVENLELDAAIARTEQRLADERENLARRTADEEIDSALQTTLGKEAGVGADILDVDPGRLKGMLGVGEKLAKVAGPVTRVLANASPQGRKMMAQLSTAGLRMENNLVLSSKGEVIGSVPSNAGGTVEGFINSRRGDTLGLIQEAYGNYADYWYGSGKGPGAFRKTRASTAGFVNRGASGRLSRRQFFEEVGKAMRAGDQHEIPEVAKTAQRFRSYYDRLLKEAQDLEIIPKEVQDVAGDMSFLNRVYDQVAIARNPNRFLELLQNHFIQSLQEDAGKMRAAFREADARDAQRLEYAELPFEEAKFRLNAARAELQALDASEDDTVGPIEDLISDLRSEIYKLGKERRKLEKDIGDKRPTAAQAEALQSNLAQREVYQEEVQNLKALGGEDLEARAQRRGELKRQIRALNRSRYMVEARHRAKLDKIEALEEQATATLYRAIGAGKRAQASLDKVSDDWEKDLAAGHKAIERAHKFIQQMEKKIDTFVDKLPSGEIAPDSLEILHQLRGQKFEANQRLQEVLEIMDVMREVEYRGGIADARQLITDALDETVKDLVKLNARRGARAAKLEADASKLDTQAWAAQIERIKVQRAARKNKLRERLQSLGDDDFNNIEGPGNFTNRAREIAQVAKDRVTGANIRLPGVDAVQGERGTELARTLSIPSEVLAREGFLVNDAETLLHAYANTLIPDVEIVRRLGPLAPDGERNLEFRKLNEERDEVIRRFEEDLRAKAAKKGEPVNKEELEKGNERINKEYKLIRDDLTAVIMRLRNQWGLPSDPDSFATRAVQTVLSLNALRFLGSAGISSIPDMAKPVFRYGLGRTFVNGWLPMISNWKAMKLSMGEAQRAFVAVETMTAHNAFQLTELFQYARRKTKFEAGLEWATSKMGIAFAYAPWTDLMKTVSSMTLNSKILDDLDLALNAPPGAKGKLEAQEFLNSLGWSYDTQRMIWKEISQGGGERINGVWVPQTERWSEEARKTYRAALYSEGAASVITPGPEIPKMMNKTLIGRLIFNLKSFAMASTSKTLMAGLQQRDMAVMQGVMISLALGALSYYLRATLAGGETERRMLTATPEQWIDEAVNASGILGVISVVQNVAQNVTLGVNGVSPSDFASVSGISNLIQGREGQQTLRSAAGGLIEDTVGPSADFAFTLAAILTEGKATRAQVHRIRQLLPLQNVFYLRRLFDQIENAIGDSANLPGKRQ